MQVMGRTAFAFAWIGLETGPPRPARATPINTQDSILRYSYNSSIVKQILKKGSHEEDFSDSKCSSFGHENVYTSSEDVFDGRAQSVEASRVDNNRCAKDNTSMFLYT